MKDLKTRVFYKKQQLKRFGGDLMDKIFITLAILISLPFLVLGAILAWMDSITRSDNK